MTAHEQMAAETEALQAAVYGLLNTCDDFEKAVASLLASEQESESPRDQLVHRLNQMSGRVNRITRILEDDVLTELLPVLDRLFALERAERGADI